MLISAKLTYFRGFLNSSFSPTTIIICSLAAKEFSQILATLTVRQLSPIQAKLFPTDSGWDEFFLLAFQ